MKKIAILLMLAASVFAQRRGTYAIEQKTALVAAAETITVQLPSSTGRTAGFESASVYCSVQCEITFERDGTAATATAITVQKVNSSDATATATAYRSSNVGTSTVIGRDIVTAGTTASYDLKNKGLLAGQNFTIRTASITGTVIISVLWQEN